MSFWKTIKEILFGDKKLQEQFQEILEKEEQAEPVKSKRTTKKTKTKS